ncbi:MAG TPA: diguanylate cyclase [Patescibacteria group bacterium]|nr:diguanylate cyclase [Patescibacteria group bacterium]
MPDLMTSFNPRRWFWRMLPWCILILGLALTWLNASLTRQQEQITEHNEFAVRSTELAAGLERYLAFHAQVLRGAGALFASSDAVSRDEFRIYVEELQLSRYFPGIQALAYAELVPAMQRGEQIRKMQAQGLLDYHIWPPLEKERYSPIIYLEPFTAAAYRALGYDLTQDPVREKALFRAADSGQAAVSGKIILLLGQEEDRQAGVLICIPDYWPGRPLKTQEQRQAALRGWIYAAVSTKKLVTGYLEGEYAELSPQIAVRVYAAPQKQAEALLYESHPGRTPGLDEVTRPLRFLDAEWTVCLEPLPAYWAGELRETSSRTPVATGVTVTVLLVLISQILLHSHRRVTQALEETQTMNRSLVEQEELLRAIYDSSGLAILLIDTERRIVYANQCLAELFQYSASELVGQDYCRFLAPEDRAESIRNFDDMLADPSLSLSRERSYRRKGDSAELWFRSVGRAFRDKDGGVNGVVVVLEDITGRRQTDIAMRLGNTVFETSPGGIIVTDPQHRIVSVNPAFTRITGYTAEEALGQNPVLLLAHKHNKTMYHEMWNVVEETGHWDGEVTCRRKNGQLFPELISINKVSDENGETTHYVSLCLDITERQRAEARIRHLAHHDYLTNLPNRALLTERAMQALTLAKRYQRQMAVIFIDLDRFKPINDDYGHDAGDAVLRTVAKRLQAAVRQSDTVCRQGGDEFVILLAECASRDSLVEMAEVLLEMIRKPCEVGELQLRVSASIGIATYPENGDTVDAIIQSADTAMYVAKADALRHIHLAKPQDGWEAAE